MQLPSHRWIYPICILSISRNRIQSMSMGRLSKRTAWPIIRASSGPQALQSTIKLEPTSFSLAYLECASGKLSTGLSPLVRNSQMSGYVVQNSASNQLSNDVISTQPRQSKLAHNSSKLAFFSWCSSVGGKPCLSEWGAISESICDLATAILHSDDWDPDKIYTPNQHLIPK